MKKSLCYLLLPAILFSLTSCNDGSDVSADGFESQTFIYDGTEKEIKLDKVPSGYKVVYENNKATEQGKYKALCKVYNRKNELVKTHHAILTIDHEDNPVFDYYLDQMFGAFMGDDYISWNVFTRNPEAFGLYRDPNDKAQWYSYYSPEEGEKQETYSSMVAMKKELEGFKEQGLSYKQLISYAVLEDFFDENIEYYHPEGIYDEMAQLRYVDSFGGYAADFPTYVDAYELRREQDVIDILDYIESLPEAFGTYPLYVQDRLEAGYPLSDYTLDEMITYLNNVTKDKEKYYIRDLLKTKIDGCDFLDDSKKTSYKNKVDTNMDSYFFPAYEKLATDLAPFKGKCVSTLAGYLSSYGEVGKAEYEFQLKTNLGFLDLDIEKFETYLDENIEQYLTLLNSTISKIERLPQAQYSVFNNLSNIGRSAVGVSNPEDMVDFLKEFAETIVPDLNQAPEIGIKYMDKSAAANSNALAYYMKSALDNDQNEYITLNPLTAMNNENDLMATMAHEGYPGHMYAYMYSKELDISNVAKILSNLTHGEGWATYVELELFEYIKEHHVYSNSPKAVNYYCDYMFAQDALAYLAYTKIDHMIHYENATVSAVSRFLDSLGFNKDAAQDIYNTLIEMPGTYAAYGFGRILFLDLHTLAEETLGEFYNEKEFNGVLLSHGWCSGEELVNLAQEYIDHQAFLNGLQD